MLQAEQRLPHATEEKAKRNYPMERGPTAKDHPAWSFYFLFFTHPPEDEKKIKKEKHTWYLVRYMQAPNRLYQRYVRLSCALKTPCEQGLPHYTYVLKAGQRLPEEKAKRSFPMGRGPTVKRHPLCVESAVHAVV